MKLHLRIKFLKESLEERTIDLEVMKAKLKILERKAKHR